MFGLLHKLSRQLPALILFWCINWIITLILLASANKTHHPSLVGAALWFNMLWICAYIVEFQGHAAFHAQERERLKRFLPRQQYSRVKALVSMARATMLLLSASFLLAVAHANSTIVWLLVAACCGFGAICLVRFYLLCSSVLSPQAASLFGKTWPLVLALVLFLGKMLASTILLESWDISAAQMPYTTWCLTLFMAAFIAFNVAYILIMLVSALMEASVRRRKKRVSLTMGSQILLVAAFAGIMPGLIMANTRTIGGALLNNFYQFDTRTTFRCGDRYQTIYDLGEKTRYLAVGENQYRGFFLKNGDLNGVAVKCTTGDKFTWYPVLSREELGANAPAKNRGDKDKR
ncbi:hypothetical protein P2G74_03185 [Cronobacter muytjensii]|uniref:hypothetical protein n=1 Tax=Cronobacter muytjensii TaxID=413501 RepID=UPI0029E24C14|nr:hypothetical protein [Cronobacter muytjensii]EKS1845246.1 hypothetical protein [Cronobacter muytjensii]ELY4520367.1 hypothetical protein [Cronobacter muytjensii]ELY6273956.1 hypothetical protein [Cronobacter muytjensii]MEB8638967.1 hypothetical protein [Cronobacter muytjensii]